MKLRGRSSRRSFYRGTSSQPDAALNDGARRENPCRVKVGNGVKYMTGFHNVVHDECV